MSLRRVILSPFIDPETSDTTTTSTAARSLSASGAAFAVKLMPTSTDAASDAP